MGSNEYDKLESALRVLLMHMLKWDHQPDKRTRSWENTIAIQRSHALQAAAEESKPEEPNERGRGGGLFGRKTLGVIRYGHGTRHVSRKPAPTTGTRS